MDVTIHTIDFETLTPRTVTLQYSDKNEKVYLLGNLPHNTEIIVNQQLIDDLQKVVDLQTKFAEVDKLLDKAESKIEKLEKRR